MIARLGREIYRHDQLAWVASDVLMKRVKREDLVKEGASGWVVETFNDDEAIVRFTRRQGEIIEAAYDVRFRSGELPEFIVPEDRALSPGQVRRANAARRAEVEFLKEKRDWCSRSPANIVVLDDPERLGGFLVYFLRPKDSMQTVPVGGHYRISVGAGDAVTVDKLFVSCLTMDRSASSGKGELHALTASHVVANTPAETHVFLSLQEKLPFYIITPDSRIWQIEGGNVVLTNMSVPERK